MLYFVLCNYVNMSAVAACVIIKITIVNLTALVLCFHFLQCLQSSVE